jgi:hypothetical protein
MRAWSVPEGIDHARAIALFYSPFGSLAGTRNKTRDFFRDRGG